MDWSKIKYFKSSEFDSPDMPGSGRLMNAEIINDLVIMREYCGFPFIINSGYRTWQRNEHIGGVANSAHLTGHAVDIKCQDSLQRYHILLWAFLMGIRRIGIARSFIHIDNDDSKAQFVGWMY